MICQKISLKSLNIPIFSNLDIKLIFLSAYQLFFPEHFLCCGDCDLASVEDGNTTNVILCLVDEFGKF